MANEVKKLYEGTALAPIPAASGSVDVTLGSDFGSSILTIAWDDLVASIQASFEATSIGVGNIIVANILDGSSNRIGLTFTFQGSLASTNIDDWSVASSLIRDASTLTVTNTQHGAADQAVTPTLATTVSAVQPVTDIQELQRLTFGGASISGGTLVINGQSCSSVDSSSIQTAIVIGTGYSCTVNSNGADYDITYPPNSGDISDALLDFTGTTLVDGDSNPITPSVSTITSGVMGVAGVSQQETIAFDHVPTVGSYHIHYDELGNDTSRIIQFNDNATVIQTTINDLLAQRGKSFTVTVSGSSATSIVITWSDYADHTDVSNTAGAFGPIDGTNNTNAMSGELPLAVAGRPQIEVISAPDSPDAGELQIDPGTGSYSSDLSYNESAANINTAVGPGFTCVATDGGPWTLVGTANTSDVTVRAQEGSVDLTKALGAVIITDTQGGSGAVTGTGTANGISTASGQGMSVAVSTGTATGIATATGDGKSVFLATGTASATATSSGQGNSVCLATGTAVGTSTASGDGNSVAVSTGTADGIATVIAQGNGSGTSTGTADGVSTASGQGIGEFIATGTATGLSTAAAAGASFSIAVGLAEGMATASASGKSDAVAIGTANGISTAIGSLGSTPGIASLSALSGFSGLSGVNYMVD